MKFVIFLLVICGSQAWRGVQTMTSNRNDVFQSLSPARKSRHLQHTPTVLNEREQPVATSSNTNNNSTPESSSSDNSGFTMVINLPLLLKALKKSSLQPQQKMMNHQYSRQHQPVTESTTTTVATTTTTTTTEPSTSSNQNFMSNQNAQGQQQQLINAFAGFQHWHALAHQYTPNEQQQPKIEPQQSEPNSFQNEIPQQQQYQPKNETDFNQMTETLQEARDAFIKALDDYIEKAQELATMISTSRNTTTTDQNQSPPSSPGMNSNAGGNNFVQDHNESNLEHMMNRFTHLLQGFAFQLASTYTD